MRYQKTDGTLLRRFEWTYDDCNNREPMLDVDLTRAVKWGYGFDWLDRLVTVKTLGLRKAFGLTRLPPGSELRTTREILQDSPVAAMATEQLITEVTRSNPLLSLTSRVVYRSWLEQGPRLAVMSHDGLAKV